MPGLMELLEEAVRGPARFVFLPSGDEVTFLELWHSSESVARYLTARVGTGGSVASVLSNTPACAPSILGVWRSGNTLVSLPHPSRGSTAERYRGQIETMLALSQAQLLLVDAQYLPLIPELSVPVVAFNETLRGGPRCDTTGSGDLIQFTSGSVGTPKGVKLSSEAVAANILSLVEVIQPAPGDTPCSWLPLSHDMGFIGMFLTPVASLAPGLADGGVFPLLTPEHFLGEPSAWLRTCSEFGVTITTAPNFALELAVRTRDWHGDLDLSPMRVVITGAERVSAPTLRRFTDAFRDSGFSGRALCPAYGMAEATLAVTLVRPEEEWRAVDVDRDALARGEVVYCAARGSNTIDGANEYVSNGMPVPAMDVRIAGTTDTGGEVGEVQVRGPSMLSDYVGAQLRMSADGWFPTRDLGFLSGGELFLVGRSDDTVIVGGRNYYAPDIEAAVRHDALRPGCLAAVPLDDGGFGLVAELRAEVPDAEHERVCRELVVSATRDSGIRPSVVAVVPRGLLPKTPSGKLQRPRIAEQLRTGELETTANVTIGG